MGLKPRPGELVFHGPAARGFELRPLWRFGGVPRRGAAGHGALRPVLHGAVSGDGSPRPAPLPEPEGVGSARETAPGGGHRRVRGGLPGGPGRLDRDRPRRPRGRRSPGGGPGRLGAHRGHAIPHHRQRLREPHDCRDRARKDGAEGWVATCFDWREGSRPEDASAASGASVYDLVMHLNPTLPRRVVSW